MTTTLPCVTADDLVSAAGRYGASTAAVLPMASVLDTPSQKGARHPDWPRWAASVLVFALDHPPDNRPLDYWGGKYGTLGNRRLIGISDRITGWLTGECGLRAVCLPYPPGSGGVFLKEVAVKAGLGVIGRNNLLVSPVFGAHLRLRGLMTALPVDAPRPLEGFDPCRGCAAPCQTRCPQEAFLDGEYCVERCRQQMRMDQSVRLPAAKAGTGAAGRYLTPFCRVCELSCPVGAAHRGR